MSTLISLTVLTDYSFACGCLTSCSAQFAQPITLNKLVPVHVAVLQHHILKNNLGNYTEECHKLQHLVMSSIVANHRFGGSRGPQLDSLTTRTRVSPLFPMSSIVHLELFSRQYLPRRTAYEIDVPCACANRYANAITYSDLVSFLHIDWRIDQKCSSHVIVQKEGATEREAEHSALSTMIENEWEHIVIHRFNEEVHVLNCVSKMRHTDKVYSFTVCTVWELKIETLHECKDVLSRVIRMVKAIIIDWRQLLQKHLLLVRCFSRGCKFL